MMAPGSLDWLDPLRASAPLASLGLEWLGADDIEARTALLRGGHPAMPDAAPEESAAVRARHRVVAYGPRFSWPAHEGPKEYGPAWWVDPEKPGEIWLALSDDAPPRTWLRADATLEGIAHVWLSAHRLDVEGAARPKRFGFFGGLMDGAPSSFYGLEDWLVTCPYTTGAPLLLGTAVPAGSEKIDMYGEPEHTSRFMTAFSRAFIEVRGVHVAVPGATLLVGHVDYAPATHHATIERFNRERGSAWPLDMPVDVVAALQQFLGHGAEQLREGLGDPEQEPGILVLAELLLIDDDDARGARLRELGAHASRLVRLATVLSAYLLNEADAVARAVADGDEEIAARARELMRELSGG